MNSSLKPELPLLKLHDPDATIELPDGVTAADVLADVLPFPAVIPVARVPDGPNPPDEPGPGVGPHFAVEVRLVVSGHLPVKGYLARPIYRDADYDDEENIVRIVEHLVRDAFTRARQSSTPKPQG